MARPLISETAAGHQSFLSRQSCRCIVLMLLSLSESFFHCQKLPSSSSVSPSLQNAGVLGYSVVAGNIKTVAFTQVSVHCNFLHKLKFGGVARLPPEVGIKLGIRLADGKMMLPIAPV